MDNNKVVLSIRDMPGKVICGGSIKCKVEVKNNSADIVLVPGFAPVSPVRYTFEQISGSFKKILSQQSFLDWINQGKTVPAMKMKPLTLKPGEVFTNKEGDLAQYAIEPLPPGEYRVTAAIAIEGQLFQSEPVSISICSPLIKQLNSFYSPRYQHLYSVFVEASCAGPAGAVFLRHTFSDNPGNGLSGIPFAHDLQIQEIAAAEKIADDAAGRWICLLSGKKVIGIWGDLYVKPRSLGSLEIVLDSSRFRRRAIPQFTKPLTM